MATKNKNIVWLGSNEDMNDVKNIFSEDKSVEAFVFPVIHPVYRRTVSHSMCKGLLYLYKWTKENPKKEWCKLSDYITTFGEKVAVCSGDNPKLRHFGLIEMKSEVDGELREDGSNRTGFYKITEKGKLFVEEELSIPKYVYICNKEVLGFGGGMIDIKCAIKNKFDYRDIFATPVNKMGRK